ncbi:MAG: type VII secretion protein EssC [Firmicutes bacterium]|nr:type VII secretion protein EssC [Bacillota bacterium]
MMDKRYQIILFGKKVYRELELSKESEALIKIGTTKECRVRLNKAIFFEEFELVLQGDGADWQLSCGNDLFFTTDGILKITYKALEHGDHLIVKYSKTNAELFQIDFTIDFDNAQSDYQRVIDIKNQETLHIGGHEHCDIYLDDPLLGFDSATLTQKNGIFYLTDNSTKYGIFVNGSRIRDTVRIFDTDFFKLVGFSFYLKHGKLFTSKQNVLVKTLAFIDISDQTSHLDYPKYNRSTRMQYEIPHDEITIQSPPPKPQKSDKSIVMTLIPALAMLALTIVLRGIMGSGNKMFVIFAATSMSIGIIMSITTYIIDGRKFKKDTAIREEKYLEYISEKEAEITASREKELMIRQAIQSSLHDDLEEVHAFGKRLFEKEVQDSDFLDIYLGYGNVEAACKIKYSKQEFVDMEDPISLLPNQLERKYKIIPAAPIISSFLKASIIGVIGNREALYEVAKNMALDVAIRHFYQEVKMFFLYNEEDIERFLWMRWLKNLQNDALQIRNIMCDEESSNIILEYLYNELSWRETNAKSNKQTFEVYNVIFIFRSEGISKHPISKFFSFANNLGFTFVFFEEYAECLPKDCTEVIQLDEEGRGTLLYSEDCNHKTVFAYETISNTLAEKTALKLSSVYIDEVSLEKDLTKSITLFEILGILNIDDLDLTQRWNNSKVYKSMAAPLGVKRKNKPVYLDISDKATAHGPHGLVAGTTGSGKSEIIQSYVLSMASLFHPYDVGFVIIDFKGGGMANQFKFLPHMMGAITNIDGREINRSLLSIRAELIHRQELFSQYGVNHINDYIQLFKKGEARQALPHLIMIVDEFAELKAEFPDFMKEIISAARIGRTLGVHLILATQKPSGVVDNQIWSNSKFKLCLKVQTKEDSKEVIKTTLAAEIVEPGRAYFQVGNNEMFELFQSAYSGAKAETNIDQVQAFTIHTVNSWGKREVVYTTQKEATDTESKTQLQVMVDYVNDYCQTNNIAKLQGICLPPLPEHILAGALQDSVKDLVKGINVAIALYDDPEQQRQDALIINLSESNTYIIGSAQTGKTTLLQTMLYQLMRCYTPEELNIYIADCGSMALKVFENAAHVGGVALAAEEEKMLNLFKMLMKTILIRKTLFAEKGLGTYKAYVEAGFTDMPQILLFVDNMAVFKENYYIKIEDVFLTLCREGQGVGINIIATGAQTNVIGFRLLANFGNRIAFCCNDKGEYGNLFDRCRIEPKELPGRGLCVIQKRILEFQAALAFEGEKEIIRVENMKSFIQENALLYAGCKAAPIPEVPEIINRSGLQRTNKELYEKSYQIPIGMDYNSVDYRVIDLQNVRMLGISGKEKSGKTNFLRHLLNTIDISGSSTEAYIIDGEEAQLEDMSKLSFIKKYSDSADSIEEIVNSIYEQLEERQKKALQNKNTPLDMVLEDDPLLLLVIENNSFLSELAKKKPVQEKLNTILKQYRRFKVTIIISDLENATISYSAPDILKTLKENKKMIVFENADSIKICEVAPRQLKEYAKPIKLGDAYVFMDGEMSKVKTVLDV